MTNESVPAVEVRIQEQMTLAALFADRSYEKEESAVNFRGAWDVFLPPFVCLTGEQEVESFAAARTANLSGERRFIDLGLGRNDAFLQMRGYGHHSERIQSQRATKFSCRAACKNVVSRETEMAARSTGTVCSAKPTVSNER
jgi:hypothetical protein